MSGELHHTSWTCPKCKVQLPINFEVPREALARVAPLDRPAFVAAEKRAMERLMADGHLCPPVPPT